MDMRKNEDGGVLSQLLVERLCQIDIADLAIASEPGEPLGDITVGGEVVGFGEYDATVPFSEDQLMADPSSGGPYVPLYASPGVGLAV